MDSCDFVGAVSRAAVPKTDVVVQMTTDDAVASLVRQAQVIAARIRKDGSVACKAKQHRHHVFLFIYLISIKRTVATVHVPDFDRAIVAARNDLGRVGRKLGREHLANVTGEREARPAAFDVPQTSSIVITSRQ